MGSYLLGEEIDETPGEHMTDHGVRAASCSRTIARETGKFGERALRNEPGERSLLARFRRLEDREGHIVALCDSVMFGGAVCAIRRGPAYIRELIVLA